MGNRALIMFEDQGVGIYLHWNGGRDSVEAFLDYCKIKGYRADDYGVARMAQVIGNFFGGELSVGIWATKGSSKCDLDPGDNGIYIVNDWEIVGRYPEQSLEQDEYDREEFLLHIDSRMPEFDRVGEKRIREYLQSK